MATENLNFIAEQHAIYDIVRTQAATYQEAATT